MEYFKKHDKPGKMMQVTEMSIDFSVDHCKYRFRIVAVEVCYSSVILVQPG